MTALQVCGIIVASAVSVVAVLTALSVFLTRRAASRFMDTVFPDLVERAMRSEESEDENGGTPWSKN